MNNPGVTSEKFAWDALRESEERFRATFENAAVGIAHVAPNGTFLRVNDRLARILGYTVAELADKTFQYITHPEDLQADLALLEQVLAGEIDNFNMEKRYFRKDGQIVWANLTVGCVRRPDRSVDYLISAVEDITTRKRAEDQLRRSHDTYLSLIEKNPFGIYLVDSEFRLAQLGAGARKAFEGISPLLGRDFADLIRTVWPEPFSTEVINHFQRTLATGEPYVAATHQQRGNTGAVESYDWRIERVTLPDGRYGVVCYFYDLTERQRYEERIQLLMREVNHRSKNMLALVQSIARLTAAGAPENFARRFEERIVALAASQDLLIRGDWSGAGLHELIRSQLGHFGDLMETRFMLRGPALTINAAAAQTLGMVLHELSTNAGKYGALSNAAGRVEISWRILRGQNDRVRFEISWVERDGPMVTPPSRTGFGSTVIDKLASRGLGATVDLKYLPAGLTWRLECSASKVLDGGTDEEHAAYVTEESGPAGGGRIMVVEDEALLAIDIAQVLGTAGFNVIGPAANVEQAFRLLDRLGCDCAVLDVNLGKETAEPIARRLSEAGIPFITLSAYDPDQMPSIFKSSLRLSKPLQPQALIDAINLAMHREGQSQDHVDAINRV